MNHSFQFRIEEQDQGRRVDDFCALRFGNLSRMRIANLIDAGACLVNGSTGRAGYRLALGDFVEASFDELSPTAMSPEPTPLEIIHEDDQVIVLIKPAGMLVHPTKSVKTGTLANALAYHLNKPAVVDGGWRIENSSGEPVDPRAPNVDPRAVRPGLAHRLDRETSGLMVVAKTPRSLTILSRHFKKRLVQKRYVALVRGEVELDEGRVSAPIGRDPDTRPHWRVMESGKAAETRFKVLKRFPGATLLELEPVTGRTNQLRIHCAHIGHAVVGDALHGNVELRIADCGMGRESSADQESAIRNRQTAMRLCLHASKLAFHHPASGEWIEFASPLPDDILGMADRL